MKVTISHKSPPRIVLEIYRLSESLVASIFSVEKLYYSDEGEPSFLESICIYLADYTTIQSWIQ
jgi:hypothetical protein